MPVWAAATSSVCLAATLAVFVQGLLATPAATESGPLVRDAPLSPGPAQLARELRLVSRQGRDAPADRQDELLASGTRGGVVPLAAAQGGETLHRLTAIAWAHSRASAVIDGRLLHTGDRLAPGAVVKEIRRDSVIIKQGDYVSTLRPGA